MKGRKVLTKPGSPGRPVRDSVRVLGLYVRGQIVLSLALIVLYAAAFWALHVPYWVVIAVVGGVAAIVPHIGSLIPLGLAALSLLLAEAPAERFLMVVGLWLLIQLITYLVLMPRLVHRPLGLKELPAFAALLLGSLLFGPIGLLLAVPVLAIVLIFWRYFKVRRDRET